MVLSSVCSRPSLKLGFVVFPYAVMGVVQNIAELIDYNGAVNGNAGLIFLAFSVVLAVSSILLGVRASRQTAWPRWANVIVIAAHFPKELLHVFFFAGPFALAPGNWRLTRAASLSIARSASGSR